MSGLELHFRLDSWQSSLLLNFWFIPKGSTNPVDILRAFIPRTAVGVYSGALGKVCAAGFQLRNERLRAVEKRA